MTIVGRIMAASNATLVCEIPQPNVTEPLRCVYKPVRGEQPLWDFPDGTLAGREVSSFLVSEALGWGVVPTTLLRDGPLGVGMVQRWIDTAEHHPETGDGVDMVDLCPPDLIPAGWLSVLEAYDGAGNEVALIHADDPRLFRMAVFDVIVNNADRKGGHVLEGLDGCVYGVDHGISMHVEDKLRTVLWGWAGQTIDDGSMADVHALVGQLAGRLGDALATHITDVEIDALIARTAALVAMPVMPMPNRHRPIPWPAF